jgi:putative ABC transport system substrate-binding protein
MSPLSLERRMRRRDFLGALFGVVVAWPLAVRAQPSERKKLIGVLISRPENDPEGQGYVTAFRQGLEQRGWVPGRNIEIDYRFTSGNVGVLQALAKEMVSGAPDVLVINSSAPLIATRQVAGAIPIVMAAVADPVAQGFVESLVRPGGNITGFAVEEPSMGAKWVELLKEIAPQVRHITAVVNPDSAPFAKMFLPSMESVRSGFSVTLATSLVHTEKELEVAIATAGREPSGGLVFLPDSFLASRREMIANFVAQQKLPAIYSTSMFVRSGGLIGYGFDRADLFQRAAGYVDRILKGEKPGDLPVQMPTKFELAINLKTAKALGLEVPPMLLARADEVIE